MKRGALLMLLTTVVFLPSAFAQLAPAIFGGAWGCNQIGQSYSTYAVGATGCEDSEGLQAAADFGPEDGRIGFSIDGPPGSYFLNFCAEYNGDGTYSPFSSPIKPLFADATCGWIVGGYNYIYHNGVFFDGSGGIETYWYNVISNPRGDAFVLGSRSSGTVLAKFGSGAFVRTLPNDRASLYIARDKGGNLYIPGGNMVTKYSPNATKNLYSVTIPGAEISYIDVDAYGQAYVTGTMEGTGLPLVNPMQSQPGVGFFSVLSPKGDRFVYSSYFGGSGTISPTSFSADGYVMGTEQSYDWDGRQSWGCPGSDYDNCSPYVFLVNAGGFASASMPAKIVFGRRSVGTTTTKKVSLKNLGSLPLNVTGVQVSDPDYAVVTDKCIGSPIKPDQTCNIAVAFTPLLSGEHDGSLVIISNSLGSPQGVALTGAGK
jgi:hypothetical protein